MNKDEVKKIFDNIENIFETFESEKTKIDIIEFTLTDWKFNPSKFHGLPLPFNDVTLTYLKQANTTYFALQIYTNLECLYEKIAEVHTGISGNSIWNLKISSFISKIKKKSRPRLSEILANSIINSDDFNETINPAYAIISTFIAWRGANAHFSYGSTSIDLNALKIQFNTKKNELIESHDKLVRYFTANKTAGFNILFDVFS